MSYQSDNLDLEILEEGDPADLTTVSDNFDKIDAVAGDIATIETSPTQSSHAAGEFLLYEGRLYKVTSAISAGDSLTLGTNVSAANIGNELKSLKESVVHKYTHYFVHLALTTESNKGCYYAIVDNPSELAGKQILGACTGDWGGCSAAVTVGLLTNKTIFTTDVSQASIDIYVHYIYTD